MPTFKQESWVWDYKGYTEPIKNLGEMRDDTKMVFARTLLDCKPYLGKSINQMLFEGQNVKSY